MSVLSAMYVLVGVLPSLLGDSPATGDIASFVDSIYPEINRVVGPGITASHVEQVVLLALRPQDGRLLATDEGNAAALLIGTFLMTLTSKDPVGILRGLKRNAIDRLDSLSE
jgi:hypothetical protein